MENVFPNSLYFWFFPNLLKSMEIGILEVPSISYFGKLWEESFRHSMLVGVKVTQFTIKLPVFKEKKCSYLYNNFMSV